MTEEKASARRDGFARRKEAKGRVDEDTARVRLRDYLANFPVAPLAGYMPIRTEIDPLPAMADWPGEVCVPVIPGPDVPLVFHRWTPDTRMVSGAFGALVPEDGVPVVPRILIVPLVAFTRAGYRLGYGGGFYDRTLEKLRATDSAVRAIGFAFSAQEAMDIPLEPTDQRLDAIITEREVIETGRG